MSIPELFTQLAVEFQTQKSKLQAGGWSSLIGIITAIVGNILISFALNTQRYAHVRLQKEHDEYESSPDRQKSNQTHSRQSSRDTIRRQDEGSNSSELNAAGKSNGHAELEDDHDDDADYREDDPLLSAKQKDSDSAASESGSGSENPHERKSYLRSPYWWIGITLMVIGEGGNFLAYGFAPASIVSPLGVVALISNCLIAPIMLHEKFRKRDVLGVLISVGGAVTVVLSAQGSNPKLGPDEIWDLIKRWEFLTYLGITAFLIVVFMVASNKIGHKLIVIDLGLVGLFGGYTALSTKGVASLLSYRLWRVVTFPITYLLVAVLVLTAVMQIKYVNRALQRFDSTQVIPIQFVMFTIFVIVGSAILYRDFESATKESVIQFVGGCALTFLGVWCITSGRRGGEEDQKAKEPDEERGIILEDDEAAQTSPPHTPKQSSSGFKGTAASASESPASFTTATSRLPSSPMPPFLSQETNSTPELPFEARQTKRPGTGQQRSALLTPTTSSFLMPGGKGEASNKLRSRSSIAGSLLPQPLTSPLSSGLSVVVADSLRKTGSLRGPSKSGRTRGGSVVQASQPRDDGHRPGMGDRGHTVEALSSTETGPDGASSNAATRRRHSAVTARDR